MSQVEVRFTTKLGDDFLIPDDPYVIDSSLVRLGLSRLINDLLSLTAPVPFDFLIDGKFLRSTLAQLYEEKSLSSETTITLEYVKALTEPSSQDVTSQKEWISSIAVLSETCHVAANMAGCVSTYLNVNLAHQSTESSQPLTSLSATSEFIVSASKDGHLYMHSVADGSLLATCVTESNLSLQSVSVSPDQSLIVAGDFSGRLFLWNAQTGGREAALPRSQFKDQHSQAVTGVCWLSNTQVLTSSLDCTLAVWDIVTCTRLRFYPAGRAVTALHSLGNVVVTGHDDGRVVFWDMKPSSIDVSCAFKSHTRQVTAVAINPVRHHEVASVAQDGCLKIADSRSPQSVLQSSLVGDDKNKLFAVSWQDGRSLFTGGSDGIIRRHVFST